MSSREDLQIFRKLPVDGTLIELEQGDGEPYFCTPEGAEIIGWLNGIHFILLPEDDTVYCVEPEMEEGSFVLPVGRDFREFLSYLLYCKCTSPLAQIAGLEEAQFRALLRENAEQVWPDCGAFLQERDRVLALLAETFHIQPLDPFQAVKAQQAAFDPETLHFSEEYYEVLGLVPPWQTAAAENCGDERACCPAEVCLVEYEQEEAEP